MAFARAVAVGIAAGERNNRIADLIAGILCIVAFIVFLIWAVLVVACHLTVIQPKRITDDSITLTGVSGHFVDALDNR